MGTPPTPDPCSLAVIGLAGRFPGARDAEELWRNLCAGVESIARFTPGEVLAAGVDAGLAADPSYVAAGGVLDGVDLFDAPFFRFTPREAELLDPQHRLFLECCWEALEDAGHAPGGREVVGVFAGAGASRYLPGGRAPGAGAGDPAVELSLTNDKDFLATRVSYKLDLRGPSLDVQTACSTSLVAVWLAAQSLLTYQCDLALAGGVSIHLPQRTGYLHQAHGTLSADGRCRPFDAGASGTVRGSGAGVVVLRRLDEALAAGDPIRAVLRGIAVNNDGARKAGFSAPGADGQAEVVSLALALAGVPAASVTFVEAHGTATPVGDPIEIRALTRAFRAGTGETGFCALGSVKANLGHLDAAAGAAGLIKAVLALERRQLPPTLHFERPGPGIDLAESPFYVHRELLPWDTERLPRRCGVSSFGIGGSNAHAVLEEAPVGATPEAAPGGRLLVLSARTPAALEAATARLAGHLRGQPELRLADVAWTLQAGRRAFAWRRAAVVHDTADAAAALADPQRTITAERPRGERRVAFLFPGQGARLDPGALAGLYALEPAFQATVDECCELLLPHLGRDLGALLHPAPEGAAAAALELGATALAQPALFVVEVALARLWVSWSIRPEALLGHSLGELAAACLAGVFPLERALALVALRGRLAQSLPAGAMLAVSLPPGELETRLGPEVALAAVNAPDRSVASGPPEAIAGLSRRLADAGVEHRPLAVDRAFHSRSVEPILAEWEAELRRAPLSPPSIPFLSNLTGAWITAEEAADPAYWVEHMRRTVRFSDGARELLREGGRVLLEVGPGQTLAALARRHLSGPQDPSSSESPPAIVSSLPGSASRGGAAAAHDALLDALGRLWLAGVEVDWEERGAGGGRRVRLPTYPFERRRYWVGPAEGEAGQPPSEVAAAEIALLEARLAEAAPAPPSPPPELDELCARYVLALLGECGVDAAPGRLWPRAELASRIGLAPRGERLLGSLLRMLVEDGLAVFEGEALRFLPGAAEAGPPEPLRQELLARAPAARGLLELVGHCARGLRAVLRGELTGLEALYPEGASDFLRGILREAEGGGRDELASRLLCAVVGDLAARRKAAGGSLRILEVGTGEGLVTARLAPALAGDGVRYRVTDIGRSFVLAAERRAEAAGFRHLEFGLLDIARDPLAQGCAAASFDVVLGANVVHATPRVEETLAHLRTLLAPGGVLLLVETVRARRWADLVWGLSDGWWSFADDHLRTVSPLLDREGWRAALSRTGFEEIADYPRSAAARAAGDQALLVGRRPPADAADATGAAPTPPAAPPARSALHDRPALWNPYVAPRDATERAVAEIWRAALGIDPIGVHDNFFELGGDSLTALHVVRAVEKRFALPSRRFNLFDNPSVAAAARFLDGGPEEGAVDLRRERGERRRMRRQARAGGGG